MAPQDVQVGVQLFCGVLAECDLAGTDAHAIADTLDREKIGGPIGGLEPLGKACHLQVFHPDGTTEHTQYLGSEFFLELFQLLGNLLQGLIPGYGLKSAVHPFQGLFDALGAVDIVQCIHPLGAEHPLVERMCLQALDLYGPPIFHSDPASAAVIAECTVRQYLFSFSHNRMSFLGSGPYQWLVLMNFWHRIFCLLLGPNAQSRPPATPFCFRRSTAPEIYSAFPPSHPGQTPSRLPCSPHRS